MATGKATSTQSIVEIYIIPYAEGRFFLGSRLPFIRPLFMDRREFHSLVEEMVYHSRDARPVQRRLVVHHHDDSKRLATYFPAKASFHTKWNFAPDSDDDASTWEFSAPVAPSSRSSSCCTSGTASSTPAQEIVIRYRAGLPLDSLEKLSRIGSDYSDNSLEHVPLDVDSAPSEHVSVVVERDLKAVYRQSQYDALEDTREEALGAMKKHGLGEHDNIVCHRPGCRDTLRDVKSFMHHLHIHNIHNQCSRCPTCEKQHDDQRCPRRQSRLKSRPMSPIKDSFFRIIGKITSCQP